jgi:hypothetical protein
MSETTPSLVGLAKQSINYAAVAPLQQTMAQE